MREYKIEGAEIKYSFCHKDNYKNFLMNDVSSITKHEIIEIVLLQSFKKGQGRIILKEFCEKFKDFIIVLKAEPVYNSEEEYFQAINCDKHLSYLNFLKKYYSSCDFIDINHFINYSNANAFIYNNSYGKEVLNEINKKDL